MASETGPNVVKQGLVLTCAKCSTKNFLDPYPFWNFERQHQVRRMRHSLCREVRQRPAGQRADGLFRKGGSCFRATPRTRAAPVSPGKERSALLRRRGPILSAGSRSRSRKASGASR